MYQKVLKLINDHGLRATTLNRLVALVSSGISLLIVGVLIDPISQGWYYYFLGLVAIQSLLELGFNGVVIQFMAHEFSMLNQNKGSSLRSLTKISFYWNIALSLIFVVGVGIPVSFILKHQIAYGDDKAWTWWVLVFTTSGSFLLNPWKSLLDGSNQIHLTQRCYLVSTVIGSCVLWYGMLRGAGVLSLAYSCLVSFMIQGVGLARLIRPIWGRILKNSQNEFLEMHLFKKQQMKVGASWLMGYFSGQTLVLFVFSNMGPVAAGQVGMSAQLSQALFSLGSIWIYPKTPLFAQYHRMGNKEAFGHLVNRGVYITTMLTIIFGACALSVVYLLESVGFHRFAPFYCNVLIVLTVIIQQASQVWSISVRYMRREPFVLLSFVFGALMVVNYYISTKWGSLFLLYSINLGLTFFMARIWTKIIYRQQMEKWKDL